MPDSNSASTGSAYPNYFFNR